MIKIGLIGGADDIGRSMIYVEYNKNAIVIDTGMEFPEELNNFGVTRIVSYGAYIKNNLYKVKGLFITHIHEDHVGGIRRFLEKFNVPIYADSFTCAYLKQKHNFRDYVKLNIIKPNDITNLGGLNIRGFSVEHSTETALGYEILTNAGNIVVTGDFKLGNSREDILKGIHKWGIKDSPKVMLVESTNADIEGTSTHEDDLIPSFKKFIKEHSSKTIVITTFASSMHRLRNIVHIAQESQKSICILGRNMEVATDFMINQGLIDKKGIIFLSDESKSIPEKSIIISTGCQGEPQGGMYKVIEKLKNIDDKIVLFSSSVIPGNEHQVNSLKIALLKKGFEYIEGNKVYHTSGHARKDELICLFEALKPEFVVPVHGDYIKQLANKKNATIAGILEKNIIIVENNTLLRIKGSEVYSKELKDSLEYITPNGLCKASTISQKQTIGKNGLFIYSISGKYIKFTSLGIPENCKLNRIGRTFVQVYLKGVDGNIVDKNDFKDACEKYLEKEIKNSNNIPLIEVISLTPKYFSKSSKEN